ncbi:MAG: hypothetical protein MUF00_15060 [Gemmatimonadaceae bacterium]|jgi:hypothetical protein|nr:hypothetical protein [Gemmatimonadaceae bacterium]
MRASFVRRVFVLTAVATTLSAARTATAQQRLTAHVTPFAGYMTFSRAIDGPLGTSLANRNAMVYGAQLGVPIAGAVSFVATLGYAPSEVRVGVPIIGGINVGNTRVWTYDAGLELGGAALGDRPIAPFVQLGVGGVTTDIRASLLNTTATNVALAAGLGADLNIARGVGARLAVRDYIGRFDSREAVGLGNNRSSNLSHSVAFTAGLKLSF